ncbi:hypothetical protein LTS08_004628 [Lithohypha guttulata]|nr:hypothetical protein LTS08_004628 [Lithohypha guttulata]
MATSPNTSDDLPRSSFDGSHLHWRAFRRDVLAPHRIRILEGPPDHPLPHSLVALIDAAQKDVGKFEVQRQKFREQVVGGRGFGPSPLFPPNLLPAIDDEPALARCMVPKFDREALPKRLTNHSGPFYELSKPRSGLGCGFSHDAFTGLEISNMPSHLMANGTVVRFDTGYIGPGTSLFCPFLVFERTFGQKEQRLEAANNQCAIAGAWSNRSLQMLYAQAWSSSDEDCPESPVTFSCTIDNEIAIVNYHWIDDSLSYCMSPICGFDLVDDEHFHHFNIWIQAIGQWGVRTLLPVVKRALSLLQERSRAHVETAMHAGKPELRIDTILEEDKLVTALKDSFSSIPWLVKEDDCTLGNSSVASWGSPIINEYFYNNLQFSSVPRLPHSSATSSTSSIRKGGSSVSSSVTTNTTISKAQAQTHRFKASTPLTPAAFTFPSNNSTAGSMTPPPSYAGLDTELAYQKRLAHAMDEIQDLQAQLQRLRQEMSGLSRDPDEYGKAGLSTDSDNNKLNDNDNTQYQSDYQYDECLADDEGCLYGSPASSPNVPSHSHHHSYRSKTKEPSLGSLETPTHSFVFAAGDDS